MNEIAVRLSLALAKVLTTAVTLNTCLQLLGVCMCAQNSTSWIVLNLAGLYWRVNGNSTRAVQCLRAALYYSPRAYKVSVHVQIDRTCQDCFAVTVFAQSLVLCNNAFEYVFIQDIALSALGSVFIRTGFFDDAITVLQLANEVFVSWL